MFTITVLYYIHQMSELMPKYYFCYEVIVSEYIINVYVEFIGIICRIIPCSEWREFKYRVRNYDFRHKTQNAN